MEDPNLVACLFPVPGSSKALDVIHMPENSARYLPPQCSTEPEYGSLDSAIPAPDEITSSPGLQLMFDPGAKASHGWMLGTDRDRCDIVLPKLHGISPYHCALTFDAERQLILRDFSHHGTVVTYDNQGAENRRHFIWILSHDQLSDVKKITIKIGQHIQFQIIVAKHETHPGLYAINVDRFLVQANTEEGLPQPTGSHTPQDPIYINQKKLGSGNFSTVHRVWTVSTGTLYASKKFRGMAEPQWRREASIMGEVSQLLNTHIVRFIALLETPVPKLILEYVPLGNLGELDAITNEESLTILCQSLDALTSVHGKGITHRDIKPENILVQTRDPLHIKLSDFGLSKAGPDLKTFCGTHLYAAPEIYQRPLVYTNATDIWSLGVVVVQCAYGLPDFQDGCQGMDWSKRVTKRLADLEDPLADFLSAAMVVIAPKDRYSAKDCWVQALQLSAPYEVRRPNLTRPSHGLERVHIKNEAENQYLAETRAESAHMTLDGQVSQVPKRRRRWGPAKNSTPSLQGERSFILTHGTQRPSSTAPQSKRMRLGRLSLTSQHPGLADFANFGPDPDLVRSYVAALGQDVEGGGSGMSKWESFHSDGRLSANASSAALGHNSKHGSSIKSNREHSVLGKCQSI